MGRVRGPRVATRRNPDGIGIVSEVTIPVRRKWAPHQCRASWPHSSLASLVPSRVDELPSSFTDARLRPIPIENCCDPHYVGGAPVKWSRKSSNAVENDVRASRADGNPSLAMAAVPDHRIVGLSGVRRCCRCNLGSGPYRPVPEAGRLVVPRSRARHGLARTARKIGTNTVALTAVPAPQPVKAGPPFERARVGGQPEGA
jgi:hypothetical protein